jgi:hypothetical protein
LLAVAGVTAGRTQVENVIAFGQGSIGPRTSFKSEKQWISAGDFAAAIATCASSSMISAWAPAAVHRHPTYSRRRRLAKDIHGLQSRRDRRPQLHLPAESRHATSCPPICRTRSGTSMTENSKQLLSAVIAEHKQRGKKLPSEISRKRRVEVVAAVPLTQGKLNAVRAAFKAGITPSRIARQFGISQSDIRKALASDIAKR